jgi:hypothetical protein
MHFQPVEPTMEDGYIASAEDHHHQPSPARANDPMDDVFGSGPSSPADLNAASSAVHPSDMHRLETEHATTGYREGVAAAKETSVQAGFDEGFGLGATIGLCAGQLLGTVEAVAEALKSRADDAAAAALKLQEEARAELGTDKIFSAEYWAEDGNWRYDVEAKDGGEVLFADVANAHPLIQKWTALVDEQIKLWKIDRSILDDENGPRLESISDEPIASSAAPTAKKPLDW